MTMVPGDPSPHRAPTNLQMRELRAQRLERTALALFAAIGGFALGAVLTLILLTNGA